MRAASSGALADATGPIRRRQIRRPLTSASNSCARAIDAPCSSDSACSAFCWLAKLATCRVTSSPAAAAAGTFAAAGADELLTTASANWLRVAASICAGVALPCLAAATVAGSTSRSGLPGLPVATRTRRDFIHASNSSALITLPSRCMSKR